MKKKTIKLSVMFIHRSGGHASSSSIEGYILYQNLFGIWGSWRVFWMVITYRIYIIIQNLRRNRLRKVLNFVLNHRDA